MQKAWSCYHHMQRYQRYVWHPQWKFDVKITWGDPIIEEAAHSPIEKREKLAPYRFRDGIMESFWRWEYHLRSWAHPSRSPPQLQNHLEVTTLRIRGKFPSPRSTDWSSLFASYEMKKDNHEDMASLNSIARKTLLLHTKAQITARLTIERLSSISKEVR